MRTCASSVLVTMLLGPAVGCGGTYDDAAPRGVGGSDGGGGSALVGAGAVDGNAGASTSAPEATCPDLPGGFSLSTTTRGWEPETYGGPAIVERSNPDELMLYVAEESNPAANVRRTTVVGLEAMPLFPVGARVWLQADVDQSFGRRHAYRFVISEAEGGSILLASAYDRELPGIRIAGTSDSCSQVTESCSSTTSISVVVDLEADDRVSVPDTGQATLHLGGVAYDVASFFKREEGEGGVCGYDHFSDIAPTLHLVAQDVEVRAKALPRVMLPACSLGNDPRGSVFFDGSGVFEGPVVYAGEGLFGSLSFVALESPLDAAAPLFRIGAEGIQLKAPQLNAELWATLNGSKVQALRETEDGPLMVAAASQLPTPFDGETASQLEKLLGVRVRAEKRCDYALNNSSPWLNAELWDLVFETDPPVTARPGVRTPLTLDGHEYEVWFTAVDIPLYFSIYRVD